MKNRTSTPVVILLLGMLTAGILVWVSSSPANSGLSQILIIISGMLTMATFTALQQAIESSAQHRITRIPFSEALLSDLLTQEQQRTTHRFEPPPIGVTPSWELDAQQLLGYDNTLALAKLRMDVERELRRLAFEAGIDFTRRPLGSISLANELVKTGVLSDNLLPVLREVVGIANQAIHGTQVPGDEATAVVRIGQQLLDQLRNASGTRGK